MIPMKKLYGLMGFLMCVVTIANIWNLISNWAIMNLPSKISFIAGSVLFQGLFAVMFVWLYKITPDMTINNSDLDDLLKQYGK